MPVAVWLIHIQNTVPVKEIVKVSFTLEPYDKLLPHVTSGEGYVVLHDLL